MSREFSEIHSALKKATDEGLAVNFIWAALIAAKNGADVVEAVAKAREAWNLDDLQP